MDHLEVEHSSSSKGFRFEEVQDLFTMIRFWVEEGRTYKRNKGGMVRDPRREEGGVPVLVVGDQLER